MRRVTDNDVAFAGIVIGTRSGSDGHTTEMACDAHTYYGRLRNDGRADFAKELEHPEAAPRATTGELWPELPHGQWIGWKIVIFNRDDVVRRRVVSRSRRRSRRRRVGAGGAHRGRRHMGRHDDVSALRAGRRRVDRRTARGRRRARPQHRGRARGVPLDQHPRDRSALSQLEVDREADRELRAILALSREL